MKQAYRFGVPLPVSAQVWQQLNALMAKGFALQNTSSLLRVWRWTGAIASANASVAAFGLTRLAAVDFPCKTLPI